MTSIRSGVSALRFFIEYCCAHSNCARTPCLLRHPHTNHRIHPHDTATAHTNRHTHAHTTTSIHNTLPPRPNAHTHHHTDYSCVFAGGYRRRRAHFLLRGGEAARRRNPVFRIRVLESGIQHKDRGDDSARGGNPQVRSKFPKAFLMYTITPALSSFCCASV